jgi:hypothetical protein
MAKVNPAKLVADIYRRGRSYREFVGFEGSTQKTVPSPQWELDSKRNNPEPQRPEDQRAPTYDNNTKEAWLTGRGPVHPHFDATPKSKKPYPY